MGIYADAHRLPLDAAVGWLTVRDIEVRERFGEPRHNCWQPTPEEPPRVLYLGRMNSRVLDVMTGAFHGPPRAMYRKFRGEEWDDPRAWAALGARLVGWPSAFSNDELPLQQGADEYPLRYTLPQEIEAICEVLAQMTPAQMREQLDQAVAESVSEEAVRRWARLGYGGDAYEGYELNKEEAHEAAGNLLLNMRQFYEAARAEGQIVIHDMR